MSCKGPCPVCTHPEREIIQEAIDRGEPYRELSARHKVSIGAMRRHRSGCVGSPTDAGDGINWTLKQPFPERSQELPHPINFTGQEATVITEPLEGHYLASFPDDQLQPNERQERRVRQEGRAKLKLAGGDVSLTEEQRVRLQIACSGYYLYDRPVEELSQQELNKREALHSAIRKLEESAHV